MLFCEVSPVYWSRQFLFFCESWLVETERHWRSRSGESTPISLPQESFRCVYVKILGGCIFHCFLCFVKTDGPWPWWIFFFVQEAKNGVACTCVCCLCVWCLCQTRGKVYLNTIHLTEFDFVFILFKNMGFVVGTFMKLGVTLIKHTMRTRKKSILLKIASLNCPGLGNYQKRWDVFQYLRNNFQCTFYKIPILSPK